MALHIATSSAIEIPAANLRNHCCKNLKKKKIKLGTAHDFGLFGETAGLGSNSTRRNKPAALPPFTSFPEPPGPAAPSPAMVGAALLALHVVTSVSLLCSWLS